MFTGGGGGGGGAVDGARLFVSAVCGGVLLVRLFLCPLGCLLVRMLQRPTGLRWRTQFNERQLPSTTNYDDDDDAANAHIPPVACILCLWFYIFSSAMLSVQFP